MSVQYDYVLYHGGCYDGFGAAFTAYRALGDAAQYVPVNYGQVPPELPAGSRVLICDFSYPRDQLLAFAAQHTVQVLDHHKTARDALDGLAFATFDMDHSGAYLTWRHFFPDVPVPEFILYLEDRDLWLFKLSLSRAVSMALRAYEFDFAVWADLFDNVERLRTEGPAIERFTQQMVGLMCNNAREQVVGGHLVPVTNATVFFSEVGEELCIRNPSAPFAAYYLDRKDGARQWGLRSRHGFDVSVVAKALGGGGHPAAAGFVEARGAPTPAMIELRAAAEEVVREMAYLFERDAQDDATLAANDIKDALAYRRLRAALTVPEGTSA